MWNKRLLSNPKHESPIEAFKRTLALAESEHDKAMKKLLEATEELTKVYRYPCMTCPTSNCDGCPFAKH